MIHNRRSIRLPGYDYAQPGGYFVTMVTFQRDCLFGEIVAEEMVLNDWGGLALNEWRRLGGRFDRVIVDEFTIMPNHVHGILFITKADNVGAGQYGPHSVGAGQENTIDSRVGAGQESAIDTRESSLAPPLPIHPPLPITPSGVAPASLGAIVGAFKSTTARLINGLRHTPGAPVWQRNYYEHIIRHDIELKRIREYILNNPRQWELDNENPNSLQAESP